MGDLKYRVLRDTPIPPTMPGRKGIWRHLPLGDLSPGDALEIPLHEDEVADKIDSLRSYISRCGKRNSAVYSVHIIPLGISVWRKA